MRKIIYGLILVLTLCIPTKSFAATEPAWGPADTVECHKIGPGIHYTKIIYHKMPLILWYTVIDLTNEYNKIEEVQSRHQVPDVLRWDVMTHFRENSREGHQVKVAWNHDFFSYDDGVCIGNNIVEGEMTRTLWGRSMLAITKDKKAAVFNPNNMSCSVTAPDGQSVSIDSYNGMATGISGDCILFNKMNALTLSEAGKYIKLQPQGEWTVNGAPIPCKVLEITSTPIQTSATEYVLFLRGTKLTALDSHLAVGDVLNVSQKFNGATWGTPPADILNAFHGYPSLAHDGVLHDGEYNDFENGREYEKSSHVLAGISQDKTKLYVLLNEMSSASQAVDCVELTNWMLNRGAWDVVNFDSGGSAAIVVDSVMLNLPGRGSVRPVEDAMLAVSLAPTDPAIHHLSFSKPHISPTTISLTPLRVMSFNKYDEVKEADVKGCTFTCSPAALGTVDAEGIFHSGANGMSGRIIAEKNGMTTEIAVDTRTASGVAPADTAILINGKRAYFIPITGTVDETDYSLDAAAFQWSSSNSDVCTVENGILRGLKNGDATITGSFDTLSFAIKVKVEIPVKNTIVLNKMDDTSTLGMTLSGVKNVTTDRANLPIGWTDGATYTFDISSSRAPYIKFSPEIKLYSLPDSASFQLYDNAHIVKQINVGYTDALGTKSSVTLTTSTAADSVHVFAFKEASGEIFGVPRYPITLNRIMLTLQSSKVGTGYQIGLRDLKAYYPEGTSGIGNVTANTASRKITVQIDGESVKARFYSPADENALVSIYSTDGRCLYQSGVQAVAGTNALSINTKSFGCGVYILTIDSRSGAQTAKFIIR